MSLLVISCGCIQNFPCGLVAQNKYGCMDWIAPKRVVTSCLYLQTCSHCCLTKVLASRYLPPYTTWFPFEENPRTKDHLTESKVNRLLKSTVLSQLSYLTIFVIAICITERTKLKEDPLNFNLLSIVVEVVRQVTRSGSKPENR